MRNARRADSEKLTESVAGVSLFSEEAVTGCGLVFEEQARSEGYRFIAGVDEVGRGCIAGPVVAAACILDPSKPLPDGLDDSKKLDAEKRGRDRPNQHSRGDKESDARGNRSTHTRSRLRADRCPQAQAVLPSSESYHQGRFDLCFDRCSVSPR
jgi:hypothetical protein